MDAPDWKTPQLPQQALVVPASSFAPGENDVVCSNVYWKHGGNAHFRELLNYAVQTWGTDQDRMLQEAMQMCSGRFWKPLPSTNQWSTISNVNELQQIVSAALGQVHRHPLLAMDLEHSITLFAEPPVVITQLQQPPLEDSKPAAKPTRASLKPPPQPQPAPPKPTPLKSWSFTPSFASIQEFETSVRQQLQDDDDALVRIRAQMETAQGQVEMGHCLKWGLLEVAADLDSAMDWYQTAATEGNNAVAKYCLGMCYHQERKDWEKAAQWYLPAADQGLSFAQDMLGVCAAQGWGMSQDWQCAAEMFVLASQQGLVGAKENLARLVASLRQQLPANNPNSQTAQTVLSWCKSNDHVMQILSRLGTKDSEEVPLFDANETSAASSADSAQSPTAAVSQGPSRAEIREEHQASELATVKLEMLQTLLPSVWETCKTICLGSPSSSKKTPKRKYTSKANPKVATPNQKRPPTAPATAPTQTLKSPPRKRPTGPRQIDRRLQRLSAQIQSRSQLDQQLVEAEQIVAQHLDCDDIFLHQKQVKAERDLPLLIEMREMDEYIVLLQLREQLEDMRVQLTSKRLSLKERLRKVKAKDELVRRCDMEEEMALVYITSKLVRTTLKPPPPNQRVEEECCVDEVEEYNAESNACHPVDNPSVGDDNGTKPRSTYVYKRRRLRPSKPQGGTTGTQVTDVEGVDHVETLVTAKGEDTFKTAQELSSLPEEVANENGQDTAPTNDTDEKIGDKQYVSPEGERVEKDENTLDAKTKGPQTFEDRNGKKEEQENLRHDINMSALDKEQSEKPHFLVDAQSKAPNVTEEDEEVVSPKPEMRKATAEDKEVSKPAFPNIQLVEEEKKAEADFVEENNVGIDLEGDIDTTKNDVSNSKKRGREESEDKHTSGSLSDAETTAVDESNVAVSHEEKETQPKKRRCGVKAAKLGDSAGATASGDKDSESIQNEPNMEETIESTVAAKEKKVAKKRAKKKKDGSSDKKSTAKTRVAKAKHDEKPPAAQKNGSQKRAAMKAKKSFAGKRLKKSLDSIRVKSKEAQKFETGTMISKVFFDAKSNLKIPFEGSVVAFETTHRGSHYFVRYSDGDTEHLSERAVKKHHGEWLKAFGKKKRGARESQQAETEDTDMEEEVVEAEVVEEVEEMEEEEVVEAELVLTEEAEEAITEETLAEEFQLGGLEEVVDNILQEETKNENFSEDEK